MKFRVKDTNETLPIAQDSFICGLRPDGSDVEFSIKDVELVPDDWPSFRREAAKDILAGMLSAPVLINIGGKQLKTFEDFANTAIGIADALIAKLKEK